jgi:hypothetical protein
LSLFVPNTWTFIGHLTCQRKNGTLWNFISISQFWKKIFYSCHHIDEVISLFFKKRLKWPLQLKVSFSDLIFCKANHCVWCFRSAIPILPEKEVSQLVFLVWSKLIL